VIVTGDSVRHGIDQIFAGGSGDGHGGVGGSGNFAEGAEGRSEGAAAAAASSSWHGPAMDKAGRVAGEVARMVRGAFPDSVVVVFVGNNDVVPDYYLELPGAAAMPTPGTARMLGVLYDALGGGSGGGKETTTARLRRSSRRGTRRPSAGGVLLPLCPRRVPRGAVAEHGPVLLVLRPVSRRRRRPRGSVRVDEDNPVRLPRLLLARWRGGGGVGCSAMIVGHAPPAMGSYRHQQMWREGYIRT
jgi:hypothetical protein